MVSSQKNQCKEKISIGLSLIFLIFFPTLSMSQSLEFMDESPDDSTIIVTQFSRSFNYRFKLIAKGPDSIKNIILNVSSFSGPKGIVQPVLDKGKSADTLDLGGNTSTTVNIHMDVLYPGDYQGWIQWSYKNKLVNHQMKITRIWQSPPIQIRSFSDVSTVSWMNTDPKFYIDIEDTSGQQISIVRPNLIGLKRNVSNGEVQANYNGIVVKREGSKQEIAKDRTIKLGLSNYERLKISVPGLTPGIYTGSLQIQVADFNSLHQLIKIYVRHPFWSAALAIAIGVILSFFIRSYIQDIKPLYLLRRRTVILKDNLENLKSVVSEISSKGLQIIDIVNKHIIVLYDSLGLSINNTAADIQIKEIDGRIDELPKWIFLESRLERLLQGELKSAIRSRLDQISVKFTDNPDNTNSAEIKSDLIKIEEDLNQAFKKEINSKLDEFLAALKLLKGEDDSEVLIKKMTSIELKIKKAKTQVEENEFDEARNLYNEALSDYLSLLTDKMEEKLFPVMQIKYGMNSEKWQNLSTQVRQSLFDINKSINIEDAVTTYQVAFKIYITKLVSCAEKEVEKLYQKLNDLMITSELRAEDYEQFKSRLDEILDQLVIASEKVAKLNLSESEKLYDDAITKAIKVTMEISKEEAIFDMESVSKNIINKPFNLPQIWNEIPVNFEAPIKRKLPSVHNLDHHAKILEMIFTAILIIVAIAVGFNLLYVDNLEWGALKDYFTAILWGLGLHTLTAQTAFGGVAWLRSEFTKPPS